MCKKCVQCDTEVKESNVMKPIESVLGKEFDFHFDHDKNTISDAIGVEEKDMEEMWNELGNLFVKTVDASHFIEEVSKSNITRSELIICLQQAIARWE